MSTIGDGHSNEWKNQYSKYKTNEIDDARR